MPYMCHLSPVSPGHKMHVLHVGGGVGGAYFASSFGSACHQPTYVLLSRLPVH
jgi:NADPH-dependent 2,4-dienoyl-CoA reductase/sulfur reductase-like enzyme